MKASRFHNFCKEILHRRLQRNFDIFSSTYSLLTLYLLPTYSLPTLYLLSTSSTNNKIGKLSKLQKKAIRTLSDKGYSLHTDPLFSKLGMLKSSDIHKHNASTFMYKYIKEKLPSSFNGIFAPFLEPNRTQSF